MDFIIKINPFLNKVALGFYDNSGNSSLLLLFFDSYLLLVFIALIVFKKGIYEIFYMTLVVLILITFEVSFLYNRGHKLNKIRNNGFFFLGYLEKFKNINNRYPYNIDEAYEFIYARNRGDLQKIKETKNTYDIDFNKPKENFSLTVDDDMIGWGFFAYRTNPERFELIDD